MKEKLFESEAKVMEIIWDRVQKAEAISLVQKVFGGSRKALFSALLEDEPLSQDEIDALRKLIEER